MQKLLSYLFLGLLFSLPAYAQVSNNQTLSVYLDCRGCSERFIQTEVNFVNFVRDQADAEVFLFVTRQRTGGGGNQFTLEFMGQGLLEDDDQTLVLVTLESDTEEEERTQLVRYVKLGLVGYLAEKDVLANLNLSFDQNGTSVSKNPPENDPWNSWIFEVGGNANFSGEESQKTLNLNGSIEATRITEEWKIVLDYWQNYRRQTYNRVRLEETTPGDTVEVEYEDVFITENKNLFGMVAKSLSDHWSAGFYLRTRSSTQDNIDLLYGITPTVEYSLFPYREFTRREITFRYGIMMSQAEYDQTTIYGKEAEFLMRQEFRINADFTQTWGGFNAGVDARSYLHDFSRNRLRFDARINMRVVRGLSVFLSGRYSIINDQISLPVGDVTDEERFLNLRNQATSFNYGGSIGIEFTFGSIYNNVINPRL